MMCWGPQNLGLWLQVWVTGKSYRLLKKRFWTVLLVCTEDVTHARLWSTMAAICLFCVMSCLLQYSCLCRSREVRISLFSIFLIVTIVSVFDTIFCFLSPDIFSWLDEVLIFFLGWKSPFLILFLLEVFDSCNAWPCLLLNPGRKENRHTINWEA